MQHEFPWFPRELRDTAFVPRWHIIRNIRVPNLAEHLYFVAYYSMQIHDLIRSKESIGNVLQYALIHDLPETFTGDMPGPTKRKIADPDKLRNFERSEMVRRFGYNDVLFSDECKRIVKLADLIDEVMHLGTEMNMGNQSIDKVYAQAWARYEAYIKSNFTAEEQKILCPILQNAMMMASSKTGSKIVEEEF